MGIFFNPFVIEWLFSPDGKLDFLWKYAFILILNLLFIALGIIVIKTNLRKKVFLKISWKKMLIIIIIIILTTAIIEIYCYSLLKKEKINYIGNIIMYDEDLGFSTETNSSVNMAQFVGDILVYNVTYSTDKYGRRINKHNEQEPILLFGGSFVFGGGLEDNETLNYFLSEFNEYDVYNLGTSGYSTQHMLALLEQEKLFSEINKTGGKAIYLFITDHIRRNIGDSFWVSKEWWVYSPYYYLENDEIKRNTNFKDGRSLTTRILSALGKTNIIKYSKIKFPKHKEKHTYLTYKIIEKSKKIYEEKFNGTFYVLMHPLFYDHVEYEELKTFLTANNISILEFNFVNEDNYENFKIPHDPHPNAKLNQVLAEKIILNLK